MTGNGIYMNLLKLALKNSWNHIKWTYFWQVLFGTTVGQEGEDGGAWVEFRDSPFIGDHPYITTANYWPFWTPPTHLSSINTLLNVSKSGHFLKVAFFQKVRFVFQISKKEYSILLSWAWNLNLLFTVIGGKFKFQVQDSDSAREATGGKSLLS